MKRVSVYGVNRYVTIIMNEAVKKKPRIYHPMSIKFKITVSFDNVL